MTAGILLASAETVPARPGPDAVAGLVERGDGMDPVTMILAALAAGVAAGVSETAGQSVKDAYAGLKALLKRKFAGNDKAEETLADHEDDPETYEKPLAKQLKATGADQDGEIQRAAEELLAQAKAAGVSSKYNVQVTGDVGIIGDQARMDRMKS